MIIFRYLTKEILGSLFAVTLVLLLIFLSNQLVRFLSYIAAGKIAANILLQLMGFEIPYLLALLLPLGLYLGIILAYGRLYADSEMPILHASGVGLRRLVKMTLSITIAVAAVVLVLMFWVNPLIATKKDQVMTQGMGQDNLLNTVQPGRFQVSSNGKRVVYVEQLTRNRKEANNVFIAEQKTKSGAPAGGRSWAVLSAAHGAQETDAITHDRFIVSTDGYRYDGVPGQNNYKIVQFKKYAVRVPDVDVSHRRMQQESIPTAQLFKKMSDPESASELQWRIALPISVFILMLFAVPLSHLRPRQGRYAHLVPALLVYIVYANLLFVGRNWIEQQTVSITLGMWWVHAIMLVGVAAFVYFSKLSRAT